MTVGDTLDLRWVQREEIVKIEDRKFISIKKDGNFHSLALWFDVMFDEYASPLSRVELRTGPGAWGLAQTVLVITENMERVSAQLCLIRNIFQHKKYLHRCRMRGGVDCGVPAAAKVCSMIDTWHCYLSSVMEAEIIKAKAR